ncbi:MAG: hypothetical protein RI907_1802 [Pseudomonadota bacterium]|jgi:parallel beta-helix repeat protein
MRKHLGAAHSRARAARACLGAVASALFVFGMTACGGGEDATSTQAAKQATQEDAHFQALAVTATAVPAAGVVKGPGWVAQPPEMPAATSGPAITRRFYISPTGNDNLDGTSEATAWKSLSRVAQTSTYQAGDAILLKCDGTWNEGELSLSGAKNPSLNNGLTLGAYGCADSQQRPTLSGATPLPVDGSVTWAPSSEVSTAKTIAVKGLIKRLFKQGEPLTPARHPNIQGDKRFALATPLPAAGQETEAQILDRLHRYFVVAPNDLPALVGRDMKDAQVSVRTNPYTVETARVASYNDVTGVVELATPLAFPIAKNAGYFFEGKKWMVDQEGEWAQEGAKLYYASAAPVTEELTVMAQRYSLSGTPKKTYGLWFDQVQNMRIERLRIAYTEAAIDLNGATNVVVSDVVTQHAHEDGLLAGTSAGLQVLDSRFDASGRDGIRIMLSPNVNVARNVVTRTGHYWSPQTIGAGVKKAGQEKPDISFTGWALRVDGAGSVVEGNLVQDAANAGIVFSNRAGTEVRHNTVLRPCLLLTDCGGIYTHGDKKLMQATLVGVTNATGFTPTTKVYGNLVAGLRSNLDGAYLYGGRGDLVAGQNQANGIYLDAYTTQVDVYQNTVSGAEVGIYLHNSAFNLIHHNQVQGTSYASLQVSSDEEVKQPSDHWITRGNHIFGNTLFSRRSVDPTAFAKKPYQGLRGDVTYAQLWLHATMDARTLFADQQAGSNDRNSSQDNKTLTLSKVPAATVPATWRLESPDRRITPALSLQLEQVNGAVWGLGSKYAAKENWGRAAWVALTGGLMPDTEASPVAYLTHVFASTTAIDLNGSFTKGSFTSWYSGITNASGTASTTTNRMNYLTSGCPLGLGTCASFVETSPNEWMASKTFSLNSGAQYQLTYTVAAPATSSAQHSAHLGTVKTPGSVSTAVTPTFELAPGEVRQIESLVWAGTGGQQKLVFRASDNTSGWLNKKLTFASASLKPVATTSTPYSVLPELNTLAVSVVNASSVPRQFSCLDLGLTPCSTSTIVTDQNKAVASFPVTVPARSTARYYRKVQLFSQQ